jgi:hypothetical protein
LTLKEKRGFQHVARAWSQVTGPAEGKKGDESLIVLHVFRIYPRQLKG